jgi:cytochrome c peroxidase
MKKLLKNPLFITIVTVVLISILPYIMPKQKIPKLSDNELRALALSEKMLPTPKSYKELLKVVDTKDNPLSKEKIELGKMLFFDKSLSKDKSINCASCHLLNEGGDDNRDVAVGYKGRENPFHLNSPTVLNAALMKYQFWDGRAKSVEEQAGGPIQAPFEMAMTKEEVIQRVKANSTYQKAFKEIFGEITFENIRKAIGAYERTLITYGAYDRFLDGDNSAISQKAKRGMTLFLTKGCKGCHSGMSVGGETMQKFPLHFYFEEYLGMVFNPDLKIKDSPYPFENIGGFLGAAGTQKFRVPTLRNIEKTAPYFHNGIEKDLKEVVRIMSKYQLGDEFDKEQIDDVVEFLKTLNGELVDYKIE